MFYAMYVCRAQSKFFLSRAKYNLIRSIDLLKLLGHIQGAVRASIVYHNHFIVVIATGKQKIRD